MKIIKSKHKGAGWNAIVVVLAAILALFIVSGCGGSNASNEKSIDNDSSTSQAAQKKSENLQDAVFKPLGEPDEERDVTNFRLDSGLVNGVTNTHLKFEVTNNSSEVSDYDIVVDLDSDVVTGRQIFVKDVQPGETIRYDEEVDAAEGKAFPLMIDRFSQDEGWNSDDLGGFSHKLMQDGSGLIMDWSMTNSAEETSAYEVKYRLKSLASDSYGKVVYESTLKTKALAPASYDEYGTTIESGGTDTGSEKISKKGFEKGNVEVEIVDQDRIRYIQQ